MITYYATYIGLLISRAIGQGRSWNAGSVYWLVLFTLFIFTGFRYDVGCDWPNYYQHWIAFQGMGYADALQNTEPAHWAVIVLLQQLGFSYTYLGVFAAGVFFLGIDHLARREQNPLAFLVLSFPILVINIAMSAIRQTEAIGLICFAYGAFVDRKLIRFVVFVLAAYLFHRSALVFLFLAPFIVGKFNRRNLLFAAILSAPGFYFLLQSDAAGEAVNRYIGNDSDASGAGFRLAVLILTGAAYFWYGWSRRWLERFPRDHDLVTIGAWLMLGFFGLYFISSVIGDRFGYYLIPIQLMIFARLPYLGLQRNRSVIVLAPYVLSTLVFIVWTQFSAHFKYCYLPYQIQF